MTYKKNIVSFLALACIVFGSANAFYTQKKAITSQKTDITEHIQDMQRYQSLRLPSFSNKAFYHGPGTITLITDNQKYNNLRIGIRGRTNITWKGKGSWNQHFSPLQPTEISAENINFLGHIPQNYKILAEYSLTDFGELNFSPTAQISLPAPKQKEGTVLCLATKNQENNWQMNKNCTTISKKNNFLQFSLQSAGSIALVLPIFEHCPFDTVNNAKITKDCRVLCKDWHEYTPISNSCVPNFTPSHTTASLLKELQKELGLIQTTTQIKQKEIRKITATQQKSSRYSWKRRSQGVLTTSIIRGRQ